MRVKSWVVSLMWKLALVAFATWGLLDGAGILAGHYDGNFPHMFTNVSNLFAWGYFACVAASLLRSRTTGDGTPFAPVAKYTAMVSLMVTMLIAHFMLFDTLFQGGGVVLHLVILHYVVPLMTLFDWLLFDKKGQMPVWGPFAWMSLVVSYLAVVLVAVGIFGLFMGGGTTAAVTSYPYTFLDPAISGVGGVAAFCGAMLVAFVVLGYAIFGIDKLLGCKA